MRNLNEVLKNIDNEGGYTVLAVSYGVDPALICDLMKYTKVNKLLRGYSYQRIVFKCIEDLLSCIHDYSLDHNLENRIINRNIIEFDNEVSVWLIKHTIYCNAIAIDHKTSRILGII